MVILSLNMATSLCHQALIENIDGFVEKALSYKDPFRIYNLSVSRSVNHIPSIVTPKIIHFTLDRGLP
jgi:hypothetical protein